ncbi:HAD family phosphatase [Sphaerochaeta sp. PS]|uniref:HAD family hydrolase n=1 Tax=Sphaerochaeta sp. PS TaxID=3076336 RepID=UPI0028A45A00|nr:HAD family phosphatase [Sphaerochaeta sp. PS]MDT4762899.1 HAD family phosphatase [Sphaerochaeta sp. PS]
MKTVKALIFDFNGTLFWDTSYHQRAWGAIAHKYGTHPYTREEMHLLNGRTNSQTISYLVGKDLPESQIQAISQEKEQLYSEICRSEGPLSLAPGALSLFEKAIRKGIQIAIATSAGDDNMAFYRQWFDLDSYFPRHLIITDDHIRESKPHPAIYLDTLKALGVSGSEAVVFEDTRSGILSASAAGIATIYAIASDGADRETTEAMEQVHGLIASFDQFVLE